MTASGRSTTRPATARERGARWRPAATGRRRARFASASAPSRLRRVQEPVQVACVQAESVVFDRDATIDKLAALTAQAAADGAKLVVFPEAFLSGYPFSRWARTFAAWDDARARETFGLFAASALDIPGA